MNLRRSIALLVVMMFAAFAVPLHAGVPAGLPAGLEQFQVRPFTANEFSTFVKVFAEMRGPIRSEIMKDRKADFENVDPNKYVEKVKNTRDVKKVLKEKDLSWERFVELWGNVMLAYFSIQPNATKAALIRQIADYGVIMQMDQVPEEYRPLVVDLLKSETGSTLAAAALEFVIPIPQQNIEIARDNERDLDRIFYTKYWRDELK